MSRQSLLKTPALVKQLQVAAVPRRVFPAFLAEDYDGYGQYVLIGLARSSSSAAYKARISSGDFTTGQVIPYGTPVSVFSYRGRLEVISMGSK